MKKDIVEWLRNARSREDSFMCNEAANEIESLRAKLAEVTRERDELRELSVTNIMVAICPGEDGMGEEVYARSLDDVFAVINRLSEKAEEADSFRVQLLATQAHAARLVDALQRILENDGADGSKVFNAIKLFDARVDAKTALSTPINLDALHEDLARECERLHDGFSPTEDYSGFVIRRVLEREAAAHRAKKEGK